MPFRFSRVEKAKRKPTAAEQTAEQAAYRALADLEGLGPDDLAALKTQIDSLGTHIARAYMGGGSAFTISNRDAKAYAKLRSAALVKDITEEQRAMVRETTFQAVIGDHTAQTMAQAVRPLGLHTRWARAVTNFETRTTERLVKEGMDLPKAQGKARVLAEKYRQRLVRKRAMVISRTEIMTAQNAGLYDGVVRSIADGTLPFDTQLEFITAEDEKVCPTCGPLNGVKIGVAQTFTFGKHYPPMHPNCRCTVADVPVDAETDPLYTLRPGYALAKAVVLKFNPSQPRDHDGKWTSGGGAISGDSAWKTLTAEHITDAAGQVNGLVSHKVSDMHIAAGMIAAHPAVVEQAAMLVGTDRFPALYRKDEARAEAEQVLQSGMDITHLNTLLVQFGEEPKTVPTGVLLTYDTFNERFHAERSFLPAGTPGLMTKPEDFNAAYDHATVMEASSRFSKQWNNNSNRDMSLYIQHAAEEHAREHLGAKGGTFLTDEALGATSMPYGMGPMNDAAKGLAKAYVGTVYGRTQDYLKRHNVGAVVLHRGLKGTTPLPTGQVDILDRPLNSYSTDRLVAEKFAWTGGPNYQDGRRGYVNTITVPAEHIFSIGANGPGADSEQELIAFGVDNSTSQVEEYKPWDPSTWKHSWKQQERPTITMTAENLEWIRNLPAESPQPRDE